MFSSLHLELRPPQPVPLSTIFDSDLSLGIRFFPAPNTTKETKTFTPEQTLPLANISNSTVPFDIIQELGSKLYQVGTNATQSIHENMAEAFNNTKWCIDYYRGVEVDEKPEPKGYLQKTTDFISSFFGVEEEEVEIEKKCLAAVAVQVQDYLFDLKHYVDSTVNTTLDKAIEIGIPGAKFLAEYPKTSLATVGAVASTIHWFAKSRNKQHQITQALQRASVQVVPRRPLTPHQRIHQELSSFFRALSELKHINEWGRLIPAVKQKILESGLLHHISIQDNVGVGAGMTKNGFLILPGESGENVFLTSFLSDLGNLDAPMVKAIHWALYNLLGAHD